ncbi:MAG: TonB-dependent receptor [Candidatus Omnitrophota bacterium]
MKKIFFIIYVLIFRIVANNNLYAQDYDLGQVIVSATKTKTYQRQVGSSTTVVTQEQIKKTGKITVCDVLQDLAGVTVTANGPLGGATSVDLRGAKRGQTLIMIDGVEVYDPMSVTRDFNFAHLTVDNIESIEIVRGPQSTLYGSEAMAGVINIITKKGKDVTQGYASVEAGSNSTFKESMGISGTEGKLNFSTNASRLDSEGISHARDGVEADRYSNTTISSNMSLDVSDNSNVFISTHYLDAKFDIDDGAYQDDPNRENETEQFAGKIGWQQDITENWDHDLSFSGIMSDRIDADRADTASLTNTTENEYSRFRGDRKKLEWQHNISLFDLDTNTLGFEYERESGASYSRGTNWWSNTAADKRTLLTRSYYAQTQLELKDNWFSTLGLRIDDQSIFGTEPTYKAETSYLIPENNMRLRASFGTAFRAPNVYQLYNAVYGNARLAPEESRGFDLGMEKSYLGNKCNLALTYFYNKYKNLIDSHPTTWQYVNISKGTSQGIEIESKLEVTDSLGIGANGMYNKNRDPDTGKEFGRRPRRQMSTFIDWDYCAQGNIYLSARYVGSRRNAPQYTDNVNGRYIIVDISSRYELNDNLELFGRVDNLFDVDYEPVRGYAGQERFTSVGVKGDF